MLCRLPTTLNSGFDGVSNQSRHGNESVVYAVLPALKRAGAIEDTLKTFKSEFGLTIRGVYGEGSDAAYDMYQISNSRTLGVSEGEIISHVEQAVARMCYCERVALENSSKKSKPSFWTAYRAVTPC